MTTASESTPSRVIKLSSSVQPRSESHIRTIQATAVSYRDHTHDPTHNDIMHNRSMNIGSGKTGSLSKVQLQGPARDGEDALSRQGQILNQENNPYRSPTKPTVESASRIEIRSPQLLKEESQYTRASLVTNQLTNSSILSINGPNQDSRLRPGSSGQQVQELLNKIQHYQNQIRYLKDRNGQPRDQAAKMEDVESSLASKDKQYLEKCLEVQKSVARTHELQSVAKKHQEEKQALTAELQKSKQNGSSLSKLLAQSRSSVTRIQAQRKKIYLQLQDEKLKTVNLCQQNKQLELELQKVSKIKELVRELQQSDDDKADIIKKHIAYEAQLIQLNSLMASNLEAHKHDLKVTIEQHQTLNKEIEAITTQMGVKVRDIMEQKHRLEQELAEARAETERIRKSMFVGYQEIIASLKDELLQLKEENVNLSSNSQSKITIVKLEREVKIYQNKVDDLMARNKDMEEAIEKLRKADLKRGEPEAKLQKTGKNNEYYDGSGVANLESIILNYQALKSELGQRLQQKEANEAAFKLRIEELQGELRDMKGHAQLSSRKDKTDTDNAKTQLQSIKMELKAETDSLNRKIEALENNILRKNKQIKEKDSFITTYLIQKVKGQKQARQIVLEIDKYFGQNKK